MALVTCPECGAQISDQALRCPQCGHPFVSRKSGGLMHYLQLGWMGIAIIALIVVLFTLIGTCHWKPVV